MGRFWRAVLIAGLAGAVIEMVFVLPIQVMLGNSPVRLFQSIAFGALGKAAFSEGMASAALGVAVHLLVSFVAAAVYAGAALREDVLLRRPILGGLAFGGLVYLVMNFLVVPLSLAGFGLPKSWLLGSLSLGIHLVAFGLPIAVACRLVLGAPKGATQGG